MAQSRKKNVYEKRREQSRKLHKDFQQRINTVHKQISVLLEDMQEGKRYAPTMPPGVSPIGPATARRRDALFSALSHVARVRNGVIR